MSARPDSITASSAPITAPPQHNNELHNDISNILHNTYSPDDEDEFEEDENPNPFMHSHRPQAAGSKATTVAILEEAMHDPNDSFSLQNSKQKTHVIRQKAHMTSLKEPPKLVSQRGNAVVNNISEVLNSAQSSEQLLSDILARLVDGGPFEKSALIVVSKDKKTAIVVAACGPNIGSGQKLSIEDPLNPLAQCFSKVQSFGSKESGLSPFGSRSFALAPINADHDTPVALYADCGNDKSISFEARRVFRTVVDILNERLPQIPGGIPVELRS